MVYVPGRTFLKKPFFDLNDMEYLNSYLSGLNGSRLPVKLYGCNDENKKSELEEMCYETELTDLRLRLSSLESWYKMSGLSERRKYRKEMEKLEENMKRLKGISILEGDDKSKIEMIEDVKRYAHDELLEIEGDISRREFYEEMLTFCRERGYEMLEEPYRMNAMMPDERSVSSTVTNGLVDLFWDWPATNPEYDDNGPYGPHVESERVRAIRNFVRETNPTYLVELREKLEKIYGKPTVNEPTIKIEDFKADTKPKKDDNQHW